MSRILVFLFSLSLPLFGHMNDVMKVYLPLSYHGTDAAGVQVSTQEWAQAEIIQTPMVLSGAFPEDLIRAIGTPHKLPTNSANYKEAESNLLVLSGIDIHTSLEETGLNVSLDVTKCKLSENVELSLRQILTLGKQAIVDTLTAYAELSAKPINLKFSITGFNEYNKALSNLDQDFIITPEEE